MRRNAIERSQYIERKYREYLNSTFHFGDETFQSLFEENLENEKIFKGPYLDINLPFKRGKSLNELIDEGVVCESFKKLSNTMFERPLYRHQQESIVHIGEGKSTVITTGTGSGKTESFLYPILNELLKEIEAGNTETGVRAIFLYPMNALVNDQIDRIRGLLCDCPEITYGFFTGDTKEKETRNSRQEYEDMIGSVIPPNELISREDIRNNPPHLLFTNYSMLEYLLIRPKDSSIISPEYLKNWRFVVLDEAHTYRGTLGIEISLLMRRLVALAEKKPQFILTSATLGEQGKSENDIVKFTKKLTSVDFSNDDIIFSKRIPMDKSILNYKIKGDDYVKIKQCIEDIDSVEKVAVTYGVKKHENIKSILYDLLVKDQNVYKLYDILKNKSTLFSEALDSYNGQLNEEQLIAMVDLINLSEKNGVNLFELKYHSFIRPLEGAYVSLTKMPSLALKKSNIINGYKAFEIGNCGFCDSPFIIGKIIKNGADGLDYLLQNSEVDIYENYGDNLYKRVDYFLISNAVNEDEVDKEILEEYVLCTKCGEIHINSNLNSKKCRCGDDARRIIYRVNTAKDDGSSDSIKLFNNINQCPCCGLKSMSGIVRRLNLGKDEGTAVVGQMLFDAMSDDANIIKKSRKLSLKKNSKDGEDKVEDVKQFISFSDSRQQASFAAMFFDNTNTRILYKRIIWKVIEECNYADISMGSMISAIEKIIRENELNTNELSPIKNAWIAVLRDLLKVDGYYDGEGLGLYYFDINIDSVMDNIDEDDVEAEFGEYDVDKEDLKTIIKVVLDVFKRAPAILYPELSSQKELGYLEYRRFKNYVAFSLPPKSKEKGVRSFLPVNKDNKVVRYIKKIFKCDDETAKEILDIIFNNLLVESSMDNKNDAVFIKHETKNYYQIPAEKYIIKNYKSSKFYKCSVCGRLTPYNVHNICVQDGCAGKLVEVDPDAILEHNYYRNQYKTKRIEKIKIKEHTAQLSRSLARQYQTDFKEKKINILSSSTTFEMGVDIGDLDTVFMRNVPPTPANYVQRAGRAGRRLNSSAYILTYCGVSSHDYTYFSEPERMIRGIINPPNFDVVNKKIIERHMMAIYLGFFFRKYPMYFKSIDALAFENGIEVFKEYLAGHPVEINEYVDKVLPESIYDNYRNFKWYDDVDGVDEKLEQFVGEMKSILKEFEDAKRLAVNNEDYKEASYFDGQISLLKNTKMLDALSRYSVIPKYGFPVDSVELKIYEGGKLNNIYNLSRDLKVAISEYAPDSEVVVDGKKYTSQYITLPKASEFTRHYFYECDKCRRVNRFLDKAGEKVCKHCGESLNSVFAEYYIEPLYGFKSGLKEESSRMKPEKTYAGEVSYIGGGEKDLEITMGNVIVATATRNDELLIVNKSDFYMCPTCGYSEKIKGRNILPTTTKHHCNYRNFECECEELNQTRIGHSFHTDVVRLTIPILTIGIGEEYSKVLSFMYAFLEGISVALEIERNDIDGIIEQNVDVGCYDILLYDNVPGGAGHVKRLMERTSIESSLNEALIKVSQSCCDEETSCYKCLRNYYNQSFHNKLKRKYAKEVINLLLNTLHDDVG